MSRFSVIIPTFNHDLLLDRCLKSIMLQKKHYDKDFEVIVVDDASKDKTTKILQKWRQKIPSLKIIRHQENKGVAAARNTGLLNSSGDYLIFLDDDDELLPSALQLFSEALKTYPNADIITGNIITEDDITLQKKTKKTKITPDNTKNFEFFIKRKLKFYHGSYIVKRDIMIQNLYPEQLRVREDFPVWGRLVALHKIVSLNKPIAIIHSHKQRLRNIPEFQTKRSLQCIKILFERLPKDFAKFYPLALSREYLSLFRTFYKMRQYNKAIFYYNRAITLYPKNIFLTSYLRKYLKAKIYCLI